MAADHDNAMKLRSPAAERNKEPILNVLKQLLPRQPCQALEIASGTGQHVAFFASHLANVTWLPSDCDEKSLLSIHSYKKGLGNVLNPVVIDTRQPVTEWGNGKLQQNFYDLILCINMTHISEWISTEGLLSGSSRLLKPAGLLMLYGPFKLHGLIIPESNVQFDQMLKLQNPEWGLRDIDDIEMLAKSHGIKLIKMCDMPANNKILTFQKEG